MYSTEGFILKSIAVGEADTLFSLYTKDFGKMRVRAQGVRKEEAKLKGHMEPLNLTHIGFVLGRHGERLTYASVITTWPAIRGDWERLSAAHTVANFIDRYCFEGEQDEALWSLIRSGLTALEEERDLRRIKELFLPEFEKRFLECLGYDASVDIRTLPNQFVH